MSWRSWTREALSNALQSKAPAGWHEDARREWAAEAGDAEEGPTARDVVACRYGLDLPPRRPGEVALMREIAAAEAEPEAGQ